jgi:NTP pyrophosphatase (non-canonical NTP hydrolase)
MELTEIAAKIDSFINNHGGYWEPAWLLSALTEELGELSRAIQTSIGIRKKDLPSASSLMKYDIQEESGDLLFALICLTNYFGIDLEKAVLDTLKKYRTRDSGT